MDEVNIVLEPLQQWLRPQLPLFFGNGRISRPI